jgi:hypothetical protein
MDGDNLRDLPLSLRKTNPARLHRGRPDGIFISDLKQREIGPELFPQSMRIRTRRISQQASRSAMPQRPRKALDQGQESEAA